MTALILNLKAEYFQAIKDGSKSEEYRLRTDYWRRRLEDRVFSHIELRLGYPKRGTKGRILLRQWRGLRVTAITHPHFGPNPVEVYAIKVQP